MATLREQIAELQAKIPPVGGDLENRAMEQQQEFGYTDTYDAMVDAGLLLHELHDFLASLDPRQDETNAEEANVRQLLALVSDARRRVFGIASEDEHVDNTLRACEKHFKRQVAKFAAPSPRQEPADV